MLKFLQNREEDIEPKRSPIKYQPQMIYGNSYECPKQFQSPSTIFHHHTYVNPFLKFQPQRARQIDLQKSNEIEPDWIHKSNLSMIEEQKILSENSQEVEFNQSRYLNTFHKQIADNPARFRLTRGQFTNFIQKNNHYKSIGPLQGVQRSTQRIDERKKSVWLKPISKKDQMKSSLRYASSLNSIVRSSITKNSEMLTQKTRIRNNRQKVQKMFQRDLQNRKKERKSYHFELPKTGPQHQLYLLQNADSPTKLSYPSLTNKKDSIQELQTFQRNMTRKLK